MSLRARLRQSSTTKRARRSPVAPPRSFQSPASFELEIEQLALHGFEASERYRIGDAVERELARLFEGEELRPWRANAEIDRIDAGSFALKPSARAETIGGAAARAIHRSLDEQASAAIPAIEDLLDSPGEPLGAETRRLFESRFAADLSDVRVHSDARAAASARALRARAYTLGRDIVFAAGQFSPGTAAGQKLLAHELTHVLQQRRAPGEAGASALAAGESEAAAIAASLTHAHGAPSYRPTVATGKMLARQSDDSPPRIERDFEVPPLRVRMEARAVPECERGQKYDPDFGRCRPFMCKDFDLDRARRFVIDKLGQTDRYVRPLAAAIRRGRFAAFFPRALEAELTEGAKAVIAKLRAGTITIECSSQVASAESQDGYRVLLPVFAAQGSPPWSQSLLNRVVLHECLHLICSNLPSQPGKDPYENASKLGRDPGTAMHDDLGRIMTPFPNHVPKW